VETKDIDKPFHVRTTSTNVFMSGHDTQEAANVAAQRCNDDAEKLGVKIRYVVQAKEEGNKNP